MTDHPTASIDVDTAWAVVDHERLRLADLLDGLDAAEWDHPSLCEQWRVRDVAAHLTLAHMGPLAATVELARAGGRFDRMISDSARRRAALPPAELTSRLRTMAGSRRLAPGVTHLEALLDVLVHGQDIALPLGRPHPVPGPVAAAAATRVWTMRWPLSTAFPRRDRLRSVHLVATDVDWSAGEGLPVEGPMVALLLLLTGRPALLDRLTGEGVAAAAAAVPRGDVRSRRG